jgi:hypothetical protein
MASVFILGVTVRMSRLQLDRGKPLNPRTEVIGENKRAAAAFDRAQLPLLDRLIKCGASGASDRASLGDRIGQRYVHVYLAILARESPATALVFSRTLAK